MSVENPSDEDEYATTNARDLLKDVEREEVEPLLAYSRGGVDKQSLSVDDVKAALEMESRLWLEFYGFQSGLVWWVHYASDREELCVHPVNDWNPHQVQISGLSDFLNCSDERITLQVQHKQDTPLA
jgi:hypothetical protein